MKRLDSSELNELSSEDLTKRLNDLRSELSKMRSGAARGTLKKELGEIKTLKRNVARIKTALTAKKIAAERAAKPSTSKPEAESEEKETEEAANA
jgi:large subunit ribosomal protein L29